MNIISRLVSIFYRKKRMRKYDPRIMKILDRTGWVEGRFVDSAIAMYQKELGDAWIPQASDFVSTFGLLKFCGAIWVYPINLAQALKYKDKVEAAVGASSCPIAAANYSGDDDTLWVDSRGYYYVVGSEGMSFVGNSIETTLESLLLSKSPPDPPEDIKESILKAFVWESE